MTIQHIHSRTVFQLNPQQSSMGTILNLFISSYKDGYINRAFSDRGNLSRVVEGMYDNCIHLYGMTDKEARRWVKSQFRILK